MIEGEGGPGDLENVIPRGDRRPVGQGADGRVDDRLVGVVEGGPDQGQGRVVADLAEDAQEVRPLPRVLFGGEPGFDLAGAGQLPRVRPGDRGDRILHGLAGRFVVEPAEKIEEARDIALGRRSSAARPPPSP